MYNRRERSVVIISVCTNLPDSENEIISERFYVSLKNSGVKVTFFSFISYQGLKTLCRESHIPRHQQEDKSKIFSQIRPQNTISAVLKKKGSATSGLHVLSNS